MPARALDLRKTHGAALVVATSPSQLRRTRARGSLQASMIAVWLHESAVGSWAFAFTLTQAVEVPIWMRAHTKPLRGVKAFGASAITHPLLWWIFMPMWHGSYVASVLVGEALVIAIEAAYARALGVKRPLAWSCVANVASTAVGFAVYYALGWI